MATSFMVVFYFSANGLRMMTADDLSGWTMESGLGNTHSRGWFCNARKDIPGPCHPILSHTTTSRCSRYVWSTITDITCKYFALFIRWSEEEEDQEQYQQHYRVIQVELPIKWHSYIIYCTHTPTVWPQVSASAPPLVHLWVGYNKSVRRSV